MQSHVEENDPEVDSACSVKHLNEEPNRFLVAFQEQEKTDAQNDVAQENSTEVSNSLVAAAVNVASKKKNGQKLTGKKAKVRTKIVRQHYVYDRFALFRPST